MYARNALPLALVRLSSQRKSLCHVVCFVELAFVSLSLLISLSLSSSSSFSLPHRSTRHIDSDLQCASLPPSQLPRGLFSSEGAFLQRVPSLPSSRPLSLSFSMAPKSVPVDATWAHAVNSLALLQAALETGADMLECDVRYGRLSSVDAGEQPGPRSLEYRLHCAALARRAAKRGHGPSQGRYFEDAEKRRLSALDLSPRPQPAQPQPSASALSTRHPRYDPIPSSLFFPRPR